MRRTRASLLLPALLPLLLPALAACASDPDPRGGDAPAAGGWDRFASAEAPPPPEFSGALSVPTPSVAASPVREFTAEEKAFFDEAWRCFKEDSPRWLLARERWQAMDAAARGLLASTLHRAMVSARAQSAVHLVSRARSEIALLGEDAVPALVGGLSVRAVRREDGTVAPVGQAVLHDAAEALSVIGPPAVPGLLDIAGSGEMSLVQEAVFALGNIGDPRAEGALLRLSRDPEWALRGAAVLALRRLPGEAARDRLVEALSDPETFVAQRAAQGIVTGKRTDCLPGVVDQLERGVAAGAIFQVRACAWALKEVSGRDLGSDPAAWRAFLGAGGGR